MRYAVLFAALVAASGCTGRTEIVVGVVTDLKARNQIDLVTFQALRDGTPVIDHSWNLADVPANQYELPGSFGIYSPDGSEVKVELVVSGWRGDQLIVSRRSLLSLISGATLFLRMGLVGDCGTLDGPTCSSDETCIEGVCRPAETNAHRLPDYRSSLVDHVDCTSGTRFVISSSGEPMPSDGEECAADEYCQEGTCLKRLPEDPPPSTMQPEWVDTSNPSPAPLRALGGADASGDIYAVGEGGVVLHGSGGAEDPIWTPEASGLATSLFGVWLGGPDDVFACGSGGVILHRKGGVWSPEPLPPEVVVDRLDGLWGSSLDDIWAVGRAPGNLPVIVHRVAGKWRVQPGLAGPSGLRAIWGSAADDVWAVGGDSHVQHFDGGSWKRLEVEPGHDFLAVGGSPEGVFLVGRKGLIARARLSGITVESAPLASDLFAVWGKKTLYAVGDYGKILFSAGDGTWKEQISGTEAALFAVFGVRGHIYAAGRLGKILRSQGMTGGQCFTDEDCPPSCTGSTLVTSRCQANTCTEVTRAACAGGFVCAADGLACNTSCGGDAECQDGFYCDAQGGCKARLAQGTACDTEVECKSAGCHQCAEGFFCTDHVCCDKSPAQCGGCMQCSAPTGTCDPVPAGEDPRGTCAGMTGECTQTLCNGKGSCNNSGNACGTNQCSSGQLTTHTCLDGACTADAAVPCANASPCADGTSCAGKCADDAGCPSGFYCNQNGDCAAQKTKGGVCNTLAAPAGHCKTAGCRECATATQCVDGYCCDSDCKGQCQACDLSGKEGTCSQVTSGQPHLPRTKCITSVAKCAGYCSSDPNGCTYPTDACGTDACSGTSLTTHSCGGGSCNSNTPTSCATGYVCATQSLCASAPCSTDAQCDVANDYYCNKTSSTCVKSHNPGSACSLTNDCKSGTCHLCTGTNVCAFGVCCQSACSDPCQMCNSSGQCVTAAAGQPVQGRAACPSGTANCGASCDGMSTTCQWAKTDVVCGGPACSDDHTSAIAYCTGTGKCSPSSTTCGASPHLYACVGNGSCNASCSSSSDCASTPLQYTCNVAQGYCGLPNGQSCGAGGDCGSGYCNGTSNVCCNEYCTPGSSQYACVKLDGGVYHAWAKAVSCSTGSCQASGTSACYTGQVCVPSVGRCDQTIHCVCDDPNAPPGYCRSQYCDQAAGYACQNLDHVCLKP